MTTRRTWQALEWALFAVFLLTAVLNLARVRGGFLTNHLADLAVPAWLYVVLRGHARPERRTLVQRLFGGSPGLTLAVLFSGSAATEFSQLLWPDGLFRGRFDPWDLVAYGVGLLPVYLLDRREGRRALEGPPAS